MLEILIAAIVSFVVVVVFMPSAIKMLKEKGFTGTDVHKPERPEVPKGGGFVLLFAMVFALLVVIGLTPLSTFSVDMIGLFAALVSILLASMIGLLDDLLDFRNRAKVILPLVSTIPMVV